MSAIPEAEVILAVDIGSINTRASLFDIVDGRYRLVANSRVPSTAGAPLFDFSEGARLAMDDVEGITGRRLFDEGENLIIPTTGFGEGIDLFVSTISAGPKVRTVIAGLMPEVSLATARRLADASNMEVVGEISPADQRLREEQIDLIITSRPDLILLVGGTDGGAQTPLLELLELLHLALGLLPEGQRPKVVFGGNQKLAPLAVEKLSERTLVTVIPNVRPQVDVENLEPARLRMAEALFEIRAGRIGGYPELNAWSEGRVLPTSEAFALLVRYLSRLYDPDKGVLGVDLGASQITVAAAFGGRLSLSVNPRLGIGTPIATILDQVSIEDVHRWMPLEVPKNRLRDYIYNKAAYPRTIPTEIPELHMEYAVARELLRAGLAEARRIWPEGPNRVASPLMPPMEPILAGGATLARAPHPAYAAMVLIDGLQPTGLTTLVLDPYGLAPALGATARPLPMATVQLVEEGVFVSLGTVVAPLGQMRSGRRVLAYQLEPENGGPGARGELLAGQMVRLPLGPGEYGKLTLMPERGVDIGLGMPGRTGIFRVSGGAVGLILDGRGRPLRLPGRHDERLEMNQKWLWDLGVSP